jgi:hypothetical protein
MVITRKEQVSRIVHLMDTLVGDIEDDKTFLKENELKTLIERFKKLLKEID